jgi:hypothetical protein
VFAYKPREFEELKHPGNSPNIHENTGGYAYSH